MKNKKVYLPGNFFFCFFVLTNYLYAKFEIDSTFLTSQPHHICSEASPIKIFFTVQKIFKKSLYRVWKGLLKCSITVYIICKMYFISVRLRESRWHSYTFMLNLVDLTSSPLTPLTLSCFIFLAPSGSFNPARFLLNLA